jgi:hypothetical protein
MRELALFAGSFAVVFALSFQSGNVRERRYVWATLNSMAIAMLNMSVVRLGAEASVTEMIAFVAGQPLGTALAIWLDLRRFSSGRDKVLDREMPGQNVQTL